MPFRIRRVVVWSILLGASTACTRWEPTTVSPAEVAGAERSSAIRVTASDGRRYRIDQPIVVADSIQSERGCERVFAIDGTVGCAAGYASIALDDISAVEVQRINLAVVLFTIAIPLIALLVVASNPL